MKDQPSSSDPDHVLLARYVAGERAALGELAARYETALLGMARGMLTGDSSAACDAVQSMWVRVIRYAKSFKGKSEVKTWLYRILINECRDQRRVRSFPLLAAEQRPASGAPASLSADCTDPLHAALGNVGDEKREILLLCYHAGMTHQVAADILEIPVGTLKSRLHAALKELRQALGDGNEGEVVA